MPTSKESEIIKDGPLLWKLARKFVDTIGCRLRDNGSDVLGVQLRRNGTIFKVDADNFRAAVKEVKEEKANGH